MQGHPEEHSSNEAQPLLPGISRDTFPKICTTSIVAVLVAGWCVLDTWNRDTSSQLFGIGKIRKVEVDPANDNVKLHSIGPFEFPLALAFIQFACMGLLFLMFWKATSKDATGDARRALGGIGDKRWPALVGTHVLSTFWLQSLMMPMQTMSLGVFAAARAVEVPAAGALRGSVMGKRFGGHTASTYAMMSGAAFLLCYSYTQIAECLCIFNGHGVALTGIPLYFVFMLLLITPAANAVCQEAVMVQLETPPLLLLAVQNLAACAVFIPVLIGAHFAGWEDLSLAANVIVGSKEIYMLIIWLCVQMAAISAVTLAIIYTLDSFWAVALRALRVAWYWGTHLFFYYFASDTLLSIAYPNKSLWSFVMFCGLALTGFAMYSDRPEGRKGQQTFAPVDGHTPPNKV